MGSCALLARCVLSSGVSTRRLWMAFHALINGLWSSLPWRTQAAGGEKGQGVTIVTLECGGVLPGGTAHEVVEHIEKSWERGQAVVAAFRAELQQEDRDVLCPLVAGGVNLHKLYGVMHDTCHCANLVATLIVQLQERKKR